MLILPLKRETLATRTADAELWQSQNWRSLKVDWIAENWVWVAFGAAMVGMHLFGHGRHGGHGGHGGCGGGHGTESKDQEPSADKEHRHNA